MINSDYLDIHIKLSSNFNELINKRLLLDSIQHEKLEEKSKIIFF